MNRPKVFGKVVMFIYAMYGIYLPAFNFAESTMNRRGLVSFDHASWGEWACFVALMLLSTTTLFVMVLMPQQRLFELTGDE